jgi:adenylate cyclase
MPRRRRLRALLLGAVALGAVAVSLVPDATGLLRTPERKTVDARFAVRGHEPARTDIVIVAIDDRTFQGLDRRWPFPRRLHARVIDRVRRAGARAIGVDIQFTEQTTPRDDNALILALRRAPGTVLSATENDGPRTDVLGGADGLRVARATAASTLYRVDGDGIYRKASRSVAGLVTFPYALARAARDGRPPSVREDPAWIAYPGPTGTVRTVSYSDVLRGRVPADVLAGKIVLVGPTAPSLQDIHPTPFDAVMPGVEIQAAALATYLEGTPLRSLPRAAALGLDVLFALLAPLLALVLAGRTWWPRVLALAAGAAYVVVAQLAFDGGLILPVVGPLIALAVGMVGSLAVDLVTAAFERERIYDLFSRFVPDSVVEEVVHRTDGAVRLGGVARDCTVMFSDLRGFTTFSEQLQPEQVIDIVNVYLGEMSEAILDAGGTLVAYMGDGIFAVFGAPVEMPDHADRALAAARAMLGPRLDVLNRDLAARGLDQRFQMGIGLNSGRVISGNVGSERRLEYAAIGDTTNTAARLEAMAEQLGYQLLLSEHTRRALAAPPPDLVDLGRVEIRGREQDLHVYSLAAAALAESADESSVGG